ncbi:MAG: ABC transporter ATP-binding protein [Caldiserica bacterium]|nr:ABC transporter ATP-binding protein [Caldisericota bacterium]
MRIVLEGVSAGYGERTVLRDVDLGIREGELLAVIGPNGAGKTTLLRVIAGVLRPRAGTVLLDGRPISECSPREVARLIGAVAQVPEASLDFTVEELVELGRLPHLRFPDRMADRDRIAVHRALELVGLAGLAGRRLSTLSGGERRKAFIAVALAREPEVLLLDEPMAHLDLKAQVELLSLFREWAGEGVTVVATSHDLNLAAAFPRLALLGGGRLLAHGAPEEVLTPGGIREAFGVEAAVSRDPHTGAVRIRYLPPPAPGGPQNSPLT